MTTKEQDDDRAALLEAIYKALPDMDDNLAQAVRAYGDARANQAHREGWYACVRYLEAQSGVRYSGSLAYPGVPA